MPSENSEINDLIAQLKKLEMPYSEGAWESFEHFREQGEGKKRRVLFYYRLAASFIILLGFGLLTIFLKPPNTLKESGLVFENLSKNIPENKSQKKNREKNYSFPIKSKIIEKEEGKLFVKNENAITLSKEKSLKQEVNSIISESKIEDDAVEKQQLAIRLNPQSNIPNPSNLNRKVDSFKNTESYSNKNLNISKSGNYDVINTKNESLENIKSIEILSVKPLKLLKINFLNKFNIFPINYENMAKAENIEKRKNNIKNQQLSVALIPQINQMNQISSPVNIGLGGFYKVGLSKKIAFVTGIQVGKQTINQQFEQPMVSIATVGSFQPKSSSTDWWSIEIPAQISWKMPYKINQAEVSILTGVSFAGTTQKIVQLTSENTRTIITRVQNFSTGQTEEKIETKTEEFIQRDTQNQQNFNTGVLLNLSVNFSYPIGKNWLSFEPYIKNPITNIAGEEFRFLNSGVILKWNFGNK